MARSLTLFCGALLLALNDHVLKHAYPGFVTGKLSDVAGMVFFPLLLHALVPRARRTDAVLVACCIATALAFALAKTTAIGNETYRVTWGAMQWPFRAAHAWLAHRPTPGLARVMLVRDPSDLLAAPFALVAYVVGRRDGVAYPCAGSSFTLTLRRDRLRRDRGASRARAKTGA